MNKKAIIGLIFVFLIFTNVSSAIGGTVETATSNDFEVYLPLIATSWRSNLPQGAYIEDFDNPQECWILGDALRYNFWDSKHIGWEVVANFNCVDGELQFYIPLTRHGGGDVDTWFVWPAVAAPISHEELPTTYTLEVSAAFVNSPLGERLWCAHWGIVFAANEDMTDLFTFQINENQSRAIIRYPSYQFPGNNNIRYQLNYPPDYDTNREVLIEAWPDYDYPIINIGPEYNTIRVERRGNIVDFYVNDELMLTHEFDYLPNDNVGVIGGSWEVTPIDLRFDYFLYIPHE